MKKGNSQGFAGSNMSIGEILKSLAIYSAGSYFPPLQPLVEIYKENKNKKEFKDVRDAIDNVSEYFTAHVDSKASEMKPLIASLESKISENMTADELSKTMDELNSGLRSFIADERRKVYQYGHSVDMKMASAVVLFFGNLDIIALEDIENFLKEDVEFGEYGDSVTNILVDDISITINFEEYIKKEKIESNYVNPIIEQLEKEYETGINSVAYVY
jgi:hypothetical protein